MRVLLVDDDPFTRVTLRATLEALGFAVCAEAESVTDALWLARTTPFDAAVVDLDLGEGPTGIDLARALRRLRPSLGLVMLSTYEEPRLRGFNLPALPAGSHYVVKRTVTEPQVLDDAIRASINAATPANARSARSRASADSAAALASLSDQQIEIMRLVAMGLTNAEIAKRRSIEERSVEKAIARLARHFGVIPSKEQNQRVVIARTYHELIGTGRARST